MHRKASAYALFGVAAFMLLGFLRSDATASGVARVLAFFVAVVLPAVFGVMLLKSVPTGSRMQKLREQTIDSEILRLAIARQGRLTALEITSALGLPPGDVQRSLDGMVRREVADVDVSDDGVLLYTFHDARHLGRAHDQGMIPGA